MNHELNVNSANGHTTTLKSTDLNLDMNPGNVPDVKK